MDVLQWTFNKQTGSQWEHQGMSNCSMCSLKCWCFFPPQQNFSIGSLAQISSGAIRCSFNTRFRTRFRMALVQIPHEVPEGSGAGSEVPVKIPAETLEGSVPSPRVPVQLPCEVPEGFGREDAWWGSGGFRCRYLARFRRVLVQMLCEIPKSSNSFHGVSTKILWHQHFLWQKRRSFQAVGDSTWIYSLHTQPWDVWGRGWQSKLPIKGKTHR